MEDTLTEEEFRTLVSLSKKVLWCDPALRRKLQEHKVNIVPANFYSGIPLVQDVYDSFEYREENKEVYNSRIFDRERLAGFMENLYGYADEFSPPMDGDGENSIQFYWRNSAFSYSDAMAYYCVLRHFQPDHLLEIGSGYSTLVANEALCRNGHGKLTLIEPYPKSFLSTLPTVSTIIEKPVQDIPLQELLALVESSDVLFIDSTHTVKVGSDCLYLYLRVLPEVSKHLVVHSHDIYLPFGFPKKLVLEKQIYWTEQYLLYAYMLDNPKIEVLFGSAYAKTFLPGPLKRLMGGKYPGGGGSIWYRLHGYLNKDC